MIIWPTRTKRAQCITETQSAYAEGFDTALELCQQAVAKAGETKLVPSEEEIGKIILELEDTWREKGNNKWEVMAKEIHSLLERKP